MNIIQLSLTISSLIAKSMQWKSTNHIVVLRANIKEITNTAMTRITITTPSTALTTVSATQQMSLAFFCIQS